MFQKKEPTPIDNAYDRAVRELKNHPVGSAEYAKTMKLVQQLWAMKDKPSPPLSKDTLAVVGANLLGILMIITYEHANVIRSKGLGLLLRPKI